MASRVAGCIERVRVENGWGYRELAKKLNVSLSQAYEWATGDHEPNLKNLRRISRRLGVSLTELMA